MTPVPSCKNCIKSCKSEVCDDHVYQIGCIPLPVTKTDYFTQAIQYKGEWWNGGPKGWKSHDIYMIRRAREMFE